MNPEPLRQVALDAGARLLRGEGGTAVSRACTSSKEIRPGDLFVALRGERFDGHAFVVDAAARGAVGALVSAVPPGELPEGFALLVAGDTLAALQRWAGAWRARLAVRVVGVTGSNGKTTTKDLAAAALGARYATGKTHGNLNNHIGVPLTLLSLGREHGAAVVEIGMNHPGEIAPLARLAAPEAAIVTGIGVAHIEHLGTRDAIAEEKSALLAALPPGGLAVLPAGDDFFNYLKGRTAARVVSAGIGAGDYRAEEIAPDGAGSRFVARSPSGARAEVRLPVPGRHMVSNALLALAAAEGMGADFAAAAAALGEARLTAGRLERREVGGYTVWDDSYNANPDSATAALATLAEWGRGGRRAAALGAMGELGGYAEEGHLRVGREAARRGLDLLVAVGAPQIARGAREEGLAAVVEAADPDEAGRFLGRWLRPGDLLLVKGSRSARMERLLEALGICANNHALGVEA